MKEGSLQRWKLPEWCNLSIYSHFLSILLKQLISISGDLFLLFSPSPPGVWGFGVWGQGRSPWPQRGPRGAPLFIKLDESLDFRLESKMKFVVATNQILKFHKTKTESLQMSLAVLHFFPWILWVVEISKIGQTSELWFVSIFSWAMKFEIWRV